MYMYNILLQFFPCRDLHPLDLRERKRYEKREIRRGRDEGAAKGQEMSGVFGDYWVYP